jgi:hypothetical protein
VALDISASPAASLADKARLDIGQPDLVGPIDRLASRSNGCTCSPRNRSECDRAGGAHFAKGDFHMARIVTEHAA